MKIYCYILFKALVEKGRKAQARDPAYAMITSLLGIDNTEGQLIS